MEKTQLNVILPAKQKEIISALAEFHHISVNQLLNQLIRDFIKSENQKIVIELFTAGKLVIKGEEL